ncbi:hypothetical protein [Desulfotomaculum copahuensis]|uniref:Uncharacterized protein n=1 Tax=Desulfotomaculum copahuensis TaxID=1838280 RepID=A0A1B7LF77_9FIRM|nr:hypothetical protein [Desulfotomaculum copahuensis]OAT82306.1 hypothetical protein A6M21_09130 [Desulfotomaculum copahuensis]
MSCYLRHLGHILEQAGVAPQTKQERKRVDLAVREIVGSSGEKCPAVWKRVKALLQEPDGEEKLIDGLKRRF